MNPFIRINRLEADTVDKSKKQTYIISNYLGNRILGLLENNTSREMLRNELSALLNTTKIISQLNSSKPEIIKLSQSSLSKISESLTGNPTITLLQSKLIEGFPYWKNFKLLNTDTIRIPLLFIIFCLQTIKDEALESVCSFILVLSVYSQAIAKLFPMGTKPQAETILNSYSNIYKDRTIYDVIEKFISSGLQYNLNTKYKKPNLDKISDIMITDTMDRIWNDVYLNSKNISKKLYNDPSYNEQAPVSISANSIDELDSMTSSENVNKQLQKSSLYSSNVFKGYRIPYSDIYEIIRVSKEIRPACTNYIEGMQSDVEIGFASKWILDHFINLKNINTVIGLYNFAKYATVTLNSYKDTSKVGEKLLFLRGKFNAITGHKLSHNERFLPFLLYLSLVLYELTN